MRMFASLCVAASLAALTTPASAQRFHQVDPSEYRENPAFSSGRSSRAAYPSVPRQRGYMGGGLIEVMFGGNDDAAAPRAGRPSYERYARGEPAHITVPDRRPVDPKYLPQQVDYTGAEKPGTVVVDTPNKFLYLVEEGGRARRYGIGVGRPGFTWSGVKTVSMKKEWPDWRPPAEMLQRRPDLPTFMAGGPENPLGARALYLGTSLYRIHGSNEPWTIGTNVSSGCIRMRNEDVTDLYNRVRVGTRVIVM
jgi:lipoprotein-anchoring transpeptidase ErfK/SrfK